MTLIGSQVILVVSGMRNTPKRDLRCGETVSGSALQLLCEQRAPGTGFFFDHNRLAENFGRVVRQGAHGDVRWPSGRERHQQLDRARRERILREGLTAHRRTCQPAAD